MITFITKLLCKVLVIFTLIACSACSKEKFRKNKSSIININIDEIISRDPVLFSQVFSGFHIIPLETSENNVFSSINDIKIINDTIYIFDIGFTKSIYIYSIQGKFIGKICRIGRGPGEYMHPTSFYINNDEKTIVINDWDSRKLNIYDLNLDFITSINFKNRFFDFIIKGDKIITYVPFPETDKKSEDYLIRIFNNKGKIISKHLRYADFKKGPQILFSFKGGNFFSTPNDIKFYMPFCDTIYSIRNGSIEPYMSFNSSKYKLTNEILAKNDHIFPAEFEKLYWVTEYSENPDLAFFKLKIGNSDYHTFYYFNSKKTICSVLLIDDLTFIRPSLFRIINNQLVAFIDPRRLPVLKELINSNKIPLKESEKDLLFNISEYNNPVIIIYDLQTKQY